jgi:hypothetical protein
MLSHETLQKALADTDDDAGGAVPAPEGTPA